jgi:hypothetical protein
MKIKFKIFKPGTAVSNKFYGPQKHSADYFINRWLEENPNVEIISWQTTPVGTTNELYITIQYREVEA